MAEIVILESDLERDRKTCISLDQRVTGANRELAQWLLDHDKYSGATIAEWLGCGETRILDLRRWAKKGFEGKPFRPGTRAPHAEEPLESQENLGGGYTDPGNPGAAPPEEIKANVLLVLDREKAVARGFKKIFAVANLPSETAKELHDAIGTVIKLWETVQTSLK